MQEKNIKNKLTTGVAIIIGSMIIGAFILTGLFLTNKKSSAESFIDPDSIFAGREFKAEELVAGNPNAKIVFVEYSDLECPYCKELQTKTIKNIQTKYADTVAFNYRHFPLAFHTLAPKESEGSLCAREQNQTYYKKFLDRIYEITRGNNTLSQEELTFTAKAIGADMTKWTACMQNSVYAAYVQSDIQDGLDAGVDATPNMFVLIRQDDGSYKIITKIAGARDEKYISKVLDQAIKMVK
jgi:protein-disulfide isomerase